MKKVRLLSILGYATIIEGIISSIILFITVYNDEDLSALGAIGTMYFSFQVVFFSIVIGFICIAVSKILDNLEKKQSKWWKYIVKLSLISLSVFFLLICLVILFLGESLGVTLWNLATILIDIIILGSSFINLY